MNDTMRLLPCADGAVTIELGDAIDSRILARVEALSAALHEAAHSGRLPGILDVVQTFRSVTLRYDPLAATLAEISAGIAEIAACVRPGNGPAGQSWCLPVCYGGAFGPDLTAVAEATGLAPEAVGAQHAAGHYRVAMLGFLPGFPFMDGVAPGLRLPRRTDPRLRVPSGSVAVAGPLTAIYPWESPGGWHLIGRCPLTMFDPARPRPALLAPGDRVRFFEIPPERFAAIAQRIADGGLVASEWHDAVPRQTP